MATIEALHRRTGHRIARVVLNRWREDRELLTVYIWFTDGNPISLGCAGDGGISSQKTKPPSESPELLLEPLTTFDGATLTKVLHGAETLYLETDRGLLTLINDSDHLVLRLGHGRAA